MFSDLLDGKQAVGNVTQLLGATELRELIRREFSISGTENRCPVICSERTATEDVSSAEMVAQKETTFSQKNEFWRLEISGRTQTFNPSNIHGDGLIF